MATEATGFTSFFGFAPDLTSVVASVNGDDAFGWNLSGVRVDGFGEMGQTAPGSPGSTWTVGPIATTTPVRRRTSIWTSGPSAASTLWTARAATRTAATPFPVGTYAVGSGTGNQSPEVDAPMTLTTDEGVATSAAITATDDVAVVSLQVTDPATLPDGISFTSTGADSGTLDVADTTAVGSYDITVTATDDEGATGSATTTVQVLGVTVISAIQGTGLTTPLSGQTVTVRAIVVGDFQDGAAGSQGDLNGFFIQEEDGDADGDPASSEGLFVFNGSNPSVDVAVGDRVRDRQRQRVRRHHADDNVRYGGRGPGLRHHPPDSWRARAAVRHPDDPRAVRGHAGHLPPAAVRRGVLRPGPFR